MKQIFRQLRERLGHSLLLIVLTVFLGGLLPAEPAAAFRFAFLADSRTYGTHLYDDHALDDLLGEVKQHHPDFVVFGGDMTRWGGTAHLNDWRSFMKQKLDGISLYPVKGNHEIHGGDTGKSISELDREYNAVFGLKRANYAFTHGQENKTLFLVLDTFENRNEKNRDQSHISPGQLKWLTDKLKKAKEGQIIVIGHSPLKPMHGSQKQKSMNTLRTQLQQHPKVALYLCGHDHNYKVTKLNSHLTQIISGNAGANSKAEVLWCFVVVDVDHSGVHFTGYQGKSGRYYPVPHH